MSRTSYLKGECQHCRGHIEFPVETIGTVASCPHCGQATELLLPAPPVEPSVPRKALVWAVVAALILGGGLGGALWALRYAQRLAARRGGRAPVANAVPAAPPRGQVAQPAANVDQGAVNGFRVSEVALEKTAGSSLVYATGTVKNVSARQRFGVKVELDLFDAAGAKVGKAKDYQQVQEPGSEWHFKALIVESKARSAKLAAITEDQ